MNTGTKLTNSTIAITLMGILFILLILVQIIQCSIVTNLETIQTIATVLGSLAVIVATFTYFYNAHRDNISYALKAIHFFRDNIISKSDAYIRKVREHEGSTYKFLRIQIDSRDNMESIEKKYSTEYAAQKNLTRRYNLYQSSVDILNALEELALRVKHTNVINHEAMNSIKAPFIELMESHAYVLFYVRKSETGFPAYQVSLEIYAQWKNDEGRNKFNQQ